MVHVVGSPVNTTKHIRGVKSTAPPPSARIVKLVATISRIAYVDWFIRIFCPNAYRHDELLSLLTPNTLSRLPGNGDILTDASIIQLTQNEDLCHRIQNAGPLELTAAIDAVRHIPSSDLTSNMLSF